MFFEVTKAVRERLFSGDRFVGESKVFLSVDYVVSIEPHEWDNSTTVIEMSDKRYHVVEPYEEVVKLVKEAVRHG